MIAPAHYLRLPKIPPDYSELDEVYFNLSSNFALIGRDFKGICHSKLLEVSIGLIAFAMILLLTQQHSCSTRPTVHRSKNEMDNGSQVDRASISHVRFSVFKYRLWPFDPEARLYKIGLKVED